jgi:hypothetical protein
MNPTPETDSKSSDIVGFYSCATVPADFARQLERHRDTAREKYCEALTENIRLSNTLARLERERDEALAELRKWQTLRLWGAEPDFIHDFIKFQQKIIQSNAPHWIPVSQALPDDDATVLVHMTDDEVWTGYLDAETWRFVSGDRIESPVLHWRPFPDPPATVVPKCPTGKRRYLLPIDAANAVKAVSHRHKKSQDPYLCPHCKNWHLTSKKP